jgi:hypothetical protein
MAIDQQVPRDPEHPRHLEGAILKTIEPPHHAEEDVLVRSSATLALPVMRRRKRKTTR